MNAPVTVKSSGVLVMSAPLTTCAVMLAMRPVPPSSPNAVPRTCEREGERRVKGGRREGVETPNRPLRRAAHRRVEGLRSPECREWTPGKVTASTQSGPFANALNTNTSQHEELFWFRGNSLALAALVNNRSVDNTNTRTHTTHTHTPIKTLPQPAGVAPLPSQRALTGPRRRSPGTGPSTSRPP